MEILNKFFSNISKNLGIPVYHDFDPIMENIKDLDFKTTLKYKNHPSILIIRDKQENSIFCFKEVTIEEIEKEINKLRSLKIMIFQQELFKKSADIFADLSCQSITATFKSPIFPNFLKLANVTPLN